MGQTQGGAVEQSALSRSGSATPKDPYDWKAQLPPNSREKIIGKIVESLKKHLFFPGHEGLQDINRIAVGFEEKIYSGATSQSDYLRKISLKMLTMEIKSQSPSANSLQTNAANVSRNSSNLGKGRIQSESAIGFMDGNNLRGGQEPMGQPQGGAVEQSKLSSSDGAPQMDPDDRRAQLPLDSRHRISNMIIETLKERVPFSGQEQEGLHEIKKIVAGIEQKTSKIYSAATSQSDYLREISLKMPITDTKSQSPTVNSLQTNATRSSSDLGKKRMRSESAIGIMDGNNRRGAQVSMGQLQGGAVKQSALSSSGDAPPLDPDVWRAQLPLDGRHRIVNKIAEILKKRLPISGQEGLQELKKISERFEESIYSTATSQTDYLRKISLKMLTMETKAQ